MNYETNPLVRYITHNEAWDISRTQDVDFLYFWLHGTITVGFEVFHELMKSPAFAGITLKRVVSVSNSSERSCNGKRKSRENWCSASGD